jgi:hypothetical protein
MFLNCLQCDPASKVALHVVGVDSDDVMDRTNL